MIKKIASVLKRVIVAFVVLYAFNVLVTAIDIFIPINVFTVALVTFLGIPGLLSLVILFFLV